jgi:DNA-binding XRE family transcriptional regulator
MNTASKVKTRLKRKSLLQWRVVDRGFTLPEAAKFIGIANQTYFNAEHGRSLRLATAKVIAKAVGIRLAQLEDFSA